MQFATRGKTSIEVAPDFDPIAQEREESREFHVAPEVLEAADNLAGDILALERTSASPETALDLYVGVSAPEILLHQISIQIDGGPLHGGVVDSHGDHRVAMSLAIAAQLASGGVRIRDCANVATSFPGFDVLAHSAGFGLGAAPAID